MDNKRVAELPAMKARRNELQKQLQKLDETREQVSDELYTQLRDRHQAELDGLLGTITSLQKQGEEEYPKYNQTIDTLHSRDKELKRQLTDLEKLREKGAVGDQEFHRESARVGKEKKTVEKALVKARNERDWLHHCITAETVTDNTGSGQGKPKLHVLTNLGSALNLNPKLIAVGAGCVAIVAVMLVGGILAMKTISLVPKLFAGDGEKSGQEWSESSWKEHKPGKTSYNLEKRYPDAQKRMQAVRDMDESEGLAQVVLLDSVESIRNAAYQKLVDDQDIWREFQKLKRQADFIRIVEYCNFNDVRTEATKQIEDERVLYYLAINDDSEEVRLAAVQGINSPACLRQLYIESGSSLPEYGPDFHRLALLAGDVKRAAWRKLRNYPELIAEFFMTEDIFVAEEDLAVITDSATLVKLAQGASDEGVRARVLGKITDPKILEDIATTDSSSWVRKEAANCLDDGEALLRIALVNENDTNFFSSCLYRINDIKLLEKYRDRFSDERARSMIINKIEAAQYSK